MSFGRIEEKTIRPWNTPGLACLGAFFGIGLATAHQFHHVSADDLPEQSAIVHIFGELFVVTIGGAVLMAIISGIRNWLVGREAEGRSRSRTDFES